MAGDFVINSLIFFIDFIWNGIHKYLHDNQPHLNGKLLFAYFGHYWALQSNWVAFQLKWKLIFYRNTRVLYYTENISDSNLFQFATIINPQSTGTPRGLRIHISQNETIYWKVLCYLHSGASELLWLSNISAVIFKTYQLSISNRFLYYIIRESIIEV